MRASPASGFHIPPCSGVHTTAAATTHASGRWRSSTLPSPTRRHGPCPLLQPHPSLLHPSPSRLAALGAFAALTPPPRSARRRLRRPASASPVRASPASGFRIPPCSDVRTTASATTHASGRWRSSTLPSPTRRHGPAPHPSTPSLTAISPHPHGSPPSAPLPLSPLPPRSARRRRPRPTSASPVRASPASGFRIPPLLRCPHHRQRYYRRFRSLAHPPHFLPQQDGMVHAHSFNPIPPCYIPRPHGSPPSTPPPRSARRRHRRPASASPAPASPASGFRIPPCSEVRTTASASTHASGRRRSLHTSFPNKAAWSMPTPSTPSLPATSPALTARRPQPLRLAPLVVDTAVPHPRRRRRLRPPPASASPPAPISTPPRAPLPTPPVAGAPPHFVRQQGGMVRAPSFNTIPPCYIPSLSRLAAFGAFAALNPSASLRSPSAPPSRFRVAGAGFARLRLPHPPLLRYPHHRGATTHASGRWRSLRTSFANKAASSMPTPSTPSLPATSPHPHGSPPSAPLPPSTPPPRSARRRLRRPTSASPAPALPAHFLPQQGGIVHAHSFNTIPPCYIPHPHGSPPSAPLPPSTLPPRSARRRRPRPTSASPARASPASGFRIPPCSGVRTTAGATTHASGRSRSLRTPFPNKAPSSMPTPSTPSLPATSPTLTARRLRRLCRLSTPPPRSARRRLRRPASTPPARASPASGFPHPPPCSGVHTTASATTHASGRWRSLRTSFPNKAAWSMPTPSTPSLPATSPTLTARRLRRLCRPQPFRLAPLAVGAPVPLPRRRCGLRPPPASASPPAPMSAPPRAPLPTPPVAGTPCTLPSPTRRHRPCPILQPHPSLLHPLTRTARRLRRLCPSQPFRLAPLAVGTAVPLPRRRRGLRPPLASASPPAPVSAPPPAPLPSPPAACFARLPSAPSAVTATQSPCRLLSAGLAGVDSPSLIPWDFSFLTAGRACGLHTTGSRRFGGSAALPPHRLAQSPLHLMRHRSDTGLHITIVARNAFHVHHASDHHGTARRVPVTTPMVMPPVNLSVMTMMARQLDRSADFTSKGLDPSLPDRATPSSPLRRLASSTRYPSPLRSLALPAHFACPHPTTRREHPASRPALRHSRRVVSPPSDIHPCPPTGSCRPRRTTPRPACPLPARRRCGLRPSPAVRFPPCSGVRITAGATAVASGSVLRTAARSSFGSDRHSVAVPAPFRRSRRRRFPPRFYPWVLSFLTACRGFGFHTPRIGDAGGAIRTIGVPCRAQAAPLDAWPLLYRVYALGIDTYLIEIACVPLPVFPGAYAPIHQSIRPIPSKTPLLRTYFLSRTWRHARVRAFPTNPADRDTRTPHARNPRPKPLHSVA